MENISYALLSEQDKEYFYQAVKNKIIKECLTEFESQLMEEITESQQTISEAECMLSQTKVSIDAINTLKKEQQRLQSSISDLKQQIGKLNSFFGKKRKESLQQELFQLQIMLLDIEEDIEKKQQAIPENAIEMITQAIEEKKESIAKAQSQIKDCKDCQDTISGCEESSSGWKKMPIHAEAAQKYLQEDAELFDRFRNEDEWLYFSMIKQRMEKI